jgi:hypothetical protein
VAAGGLSFGWTVGVVAGAGTVTESGLGCAGEVADSAEVVVSSANTGSVSASGV